MFKLGQINLINIFHCQWMC